MIKKCFLCKKNSFVLVYQLSSKKILRCKNDGLFLAELVKTPDKIYGSDYFNNSPNVNLNYHYYLSKLKKIKKLTNEAKPKILDVGCGWGDFLQVLEKQKNSYLGIDINKEAIEICQKKGLNCKLTTIEQLNNGAIKQSFSAITMFQIIEHLQNPVPTLLAAKKLLKKNGVILVTTPNNNSPLRKVFGSDWSVYNEDSHYVFYNKETLAETFSLVGFKNISVNLDAWRFLALNYIFQRLFKSKILSSKLFSFPIPTDLWGDLESIVRLNDSVR